MEPFFFESENGRLLGIYNPSADPMSKKSIVFCPPIYQEYSRTYRLLSKLAGRWAAKGYHVLRFDYFGTGDSAGSVTDGGPKIWKKDIRSAITELTEISGSDSVSIFGVRLGATMALNVAAEVQEVNSAVVWDPILSGRAYLDDLRMSHSRFLDTLVNLTDSERKAAASELAGFQSCAWHDNELRNLELPTPESMGLQKLYAVLSSDDDAPLSGYLEQCSSTGADVEVLRIAVDCNWLTLKGVMLQVPEMVDGIESCLR